MLEPILGHSSRALNQRRVVNELGETQRERPALACSQQIARSAQFEVGASDIGPGRRTHQCLDPLGGAVLV